MLPLDQTSSAVSSHHAKLTVANWLLALAMYLLYKHEGRVILLSTKAKAQALSPTNYVTMSSISKKKMLVFFKGT